MDDSLRQTQNDYLKHLRDEDITWKETTEYFNKYFNTTLTVKTLQRRYKRIQDMSVIGTTVEEVRELSDNIIKQNDVLQRSLRKEREKTLLIAEACVASISKLNFTKIKQPKYRTSNKQDLEMHLLRGDAQVGEKVEARDTSGLGNYNFEIYKKRVDKLRDKTLLFREQDYKSLGLNKLVSPQLGDHVEGENIYKGQAFHIDRPLIDQIFQSLQYEVNNFWLPLAKVFSEIELFCVNGNHGRVGLKGQNHERTNFDYIYYKCLKQALETATEHVKVHISDSPVMLVQHGNYLFSYSHGDMAKSWAGIPYYGIERMVKKSISLFREDIDYFCMGHFHTPANLNDVIIMNGTMVGGSNLSINQMGINSIPSQKMFYFDKAKGINRESNLYLDKRIILEKNQNGIYTPVNEDK